jgi:hypothetical protein
MKATPLRHERGVLRDNRQAAEVPSRCDWSRTQVRRSPAGSLSESFRHQSDHQAVAARRAALGADWAALTAVLVTAWKLASATSAACLAALCALS